MHATHFLKLRVQGCFGKTLLRFLATDVLRLTLRKNKEDVESSLGQDSCYHFPSSLEGEENV